MMRATTGILAAALLAAACGTAPQEEPMDQLRDRVFACARVQAAYMDSLLTAQAGDFPPSLEMTGKASLEMTKGWRCPRTFQGDTLVTADIGWWCSGFYPGVLWTVYEETGDETFRDLAVKHTLPLADLLNRETDHDIGFQLMSSFGKMVRHVSLPPNVLFDPSELADDPCEPGDNLYPLTILTRGADKLAARFSPAVGAIRSWNGNRWNYPVIIDNMMNLELLKYWGHPDIADKHAVTTIKNHFREDGTTWHLVSFRSI